MKRWINLLSIEIRRHSPGARIIATTIAFAAMMIRLFSLDRFLEYDSMRIQSGEIWRIATGHLSHWTFDHLIWDAGAFAVLSAILVRLKGLDRAYRLAIAGSLVMIPLFQLVALRHLSQYRGLSGIDATLFTLLAMTLLLDRIEARDVKGSIATALCGFGFILKIAWEASGHGTLFVTRLGTGVEPDLSAHVVGGLLGIGVAISTWRRDRISRTGGAFERGSSPDDRETRLA